MYANFTEETATGTGDTLALAGVTTNSIAFSKSFADGDPVAYIVEDSGGAIKVAGVGAYVSATDDITRDDTWNWNGTVIDDNPSTNITLSGGTHTVRCDVIGQNLISGTVLASAFPDANYYHLPDNISKQDQAYTPVADRASFVCGVFLTPRIITSFVLTVNTAYASSLNTRQAIYSSKADGTIGDLLADSGNINITSTGMKTTNLGTALKLPAGRYWFGVVTDSTTPRFFSAENGAGDQVLMQPTGIGQFASQRPHFPYLDAVTGAFPATVTPTSQTGSLPLCAGFR